MKTNNTLQRYRYNTWANNRILNHLKSLPDQVYNKEIDSVFSSIHEVIVHIYKVDGMWLSVMSGDNFDQTMEAINHLDQKSKGTSLHEMIALYEEVAHNYLACIRSLKDPEQQITIYHPSYGEMTTEGRQLVAHVVSHGTYHRGNITAMLRQQGYPGIPTDYIFYLYEK